MDGRENNLALTIPLKLTGLSGLTEATHLFWTFSSLFSFPTKTPSPPFKSPSQFAIVPARFIHPPLPLKLCREAFRAGCLSVISVCVCSERRTSFTSRKVEEEVRIMCGVTVDSFYAPSRHAASHDCLFGFACWGCLCMEVSQLFSTSSHFTGRVSSRWHHLIFT